MNSQGGNWYIEYDYRTFNIIHNPKFRILIFKEVQPFADVEGPPSSNQEQQVNTPAWIVQIAEAMIEILILLFNFFNVEYKLSKNQLVKQRFKTICSVLKIQNQYCKYFTKMSLQFRMNRILAGSIRLNRFMSCILEEVSLLKKHLDQTLIDNLNQRIRETLEVTQSQGDHDLNIILLDMISLLLRNVGDPTMKGILDTNKQKTIINNILKSNQIYDQFMSKKAIQQKKFEDNRYFQMEAPIEEDPNAKKSIQENQDSEIYQN